MTTRSPNTFIIGAGPVAVAVAGALRLAGTPVIGLWARKAGPARAAAAAAGVAGFSSAPPDLLLEADAVVLAVRDDAVAEVAQLLVGTGMVGQRHTLLHCSGARAAAEALAPAGGKVGGLGTLHPLRAIADGATAMRTMRGTVFGIEGDDLGRARAQQLALAMGGVPLPLASDAMARYHAAAVMASNYVVSLLDAAAELLVASGLPRAQAAAALEPLATGAIANVRTLGIDRALTGPVRRGDDATVAAHLDALAATPALAELYRVLGRRALAITARLGEVADADDPTATTGPDPAALARIGVRLG